MTKEREQIYNKYAGKCYLCGYKLNNKFHVDHKIPLKRQLKNDDGLFLNLHLDVYENKFACCATCNINKSDYTLEEFRTKIKDYSYNLKSSNAQFKLLVKYNLIIENDIKVKFYFETFQNNFKIDEELNIKIYEQ